MSENIQRCLACGAQILSGLRSNGSERVVCGILRTCRIKYDYFVKKIDKLEAKAVKTNDDDLAVFILGIKLQLKEKIPITQLDVKLKDYLKERREAGNPILILEK